MAAAPFGKHPKLAEYIAWAKDQGCTVESGVVHTNRGETYGFTKIAASADKFVILAGIAQTEHLTPATVARFDRRLGLRSPFASVDWADRG